MHARLSKQLGRPFTTGLECATERHVLHWYQSYFSESIRPSKTKKFCSHLSASSALELCRKTSGLILERSQSLVFLQFLVHEERKRA